MKVILVEFTWQTKEIIDNKESYKRDVIVSLDPESSYILKINKISYFETYQFCNHKELWLRYKEITDRSIKITKILDETLWNTDKRFKDLNWKLFNDYYYPLKTSFDQLFYYSKLISKIIEKFNPTEIIISDSDKIIIDEDLLISTKISIIKFLLETFEDPHNKVKISFISTNQPKKTTFYNGIKESAFFNVKKKIRNTYHKIDFLINYYASKPKYLSVGSLEIQRYKKLYPKDAELFLTYNHNNSKKIKINNTDFSNKFISYLRNETNFYEQIKFENISFRLIFNEILIKILKRLDFIFYEYNKAKKILNRVKPKCVIFNSMSPLYLPTLTFRKNCISLKIPFVTWSHGGYGLTYSLASYDITDFRLCKNHISYGEYLKELVSNNDCVLKKLGFQKDQKILPVGSPRFDYDNRKKRLSKNIKKRDKPTILFMVGLLILKNQFYFGRNREKCETSAWEFQHDILSVLKKYQNKYNIIFKDYPNRYNDLWKKILKNINADKIFYVSNKYKVNDLLRISDLNIVPWISTTFFESLYFDADIFVMEEDMFEKPFKEELKDEIFYFKDSKNFLLELEKYLETGDFYTRNKKNSKNYLLKLDAINRRDELLKDALSKVN